MKKLVLALLAASFAACAPRTGGIRTGEPAASPTTGKPVIPATPPVEIPADANVVLTVSEAVGDPDRDYGSYAKVYVDNNAAGQTQIEAKSKAKKWGAKLAPGNHLFRFESWMLPPSGDWQMLDPQWQPAERFIRVLDGQRTEVTLKFFDGGIKHELRIAHQPIGQ